MSNQGNHELKLSAEGAELQGREDGIEIENGQDKSPLLQLRRVSSGHQTVVNLRYDAVLA